MLLNSPAVEAWLSRFESADQDAAITLLNALNALDSEAQDTAIRTLILNTYSSSKAHIALFASREVDEHEDESTAFPLEPSAGKGSVGNRRYITCPYFTFGSPNLLPDTADVGSEGRIARLIRDIAKADNRFLPHPTFEELRKQRPSIFLIVDDFAGSGNRINKFAYWLYNDPHLKSLHSYGKFRFHAVAALSTAIARDNIRSNPLIAAFIFSNFARTFSSVGWSKDTQNVVRKLALKYGKRTNHRHMSLGFQKTESLTLLSSSCPNTLPAILWSGTGNRWTPLFPHAQVSGELWHLLENGERLSLGDRLREHGRFFDDERLSSGHAQLFAGKLMALLAVSTKFRMPYARLEQLSMILGFPISEVQVLFDYAKQFNLIDGSGRLTESGRYELNRLRRIRPAQVGAEKEQANAFYFPKSVKSQV